MTTWTWADSFVEATTTGMKPITTAAASPTASSAIPAPAITAPEAPTPCVTEANEQSLTLQWTGVNGVVYGISHWEKGNETSAMARQYRVDVPSASIPNGEGTHEVVVSGLTAGTAYCIKMSAIAEDAGYLTTWTWADNFVEA